MLSKAAIKNNIQICNPYLVKEWHPSKNGSLTPRDVTAGSHKKVWWECSRGHEWKAPVYDRSNKHGCPYCTGNKVNDENCLQTVNTPLSKQWHPTKNGSLTPRDVTAGSNKKVWWKCAKGHEWRVPVYNRNKGSGCPYCGGDKVNDENCLQTINTPLSKQWHPTKNGSLTPRDVTAGSGKKAWWQCAKGHEWKAVISSRNSGRGCPYCAGKKVNDENCIQTVNPSLAKEWHLSKNGSLTPMDVTISSHKKVWWQCSRSHAWKAPVSDRSNKHGCPYCVGKKVNDENCLQTVNSSLAKEWHPSKNGSLTPRDVTAGSNKKAWWLCSRGHEWEAGINSRNGGRNCPYCNFQTSQLELKVFTEMKYLFHDAEHRKKIHGVECDVFLPSLNLAIEIDGAYFHKDKYEQDKAKTNALKKGNVDLIRIREKGLSKVSTHDILCKTMKIDFSLFRSLIQQILRLKPLIDRDVRNRIQDYLTKDRLANNEEYIRIWNLLPSPFLESSLEALNPSLAKEWHPTKNGSLMPKDVTLHSGLQIWWLCSRGHEWKSAVNDRSNKHGCPYCTGKKVNDENCLQKLNPSLAKEWHPSKNSSLTPRDVTAGSNKKVWWLCSKGHEWEGTVNGRSKGHGCRYCYRQRGERQ
jgi:glutaredoxin